MNILSTLRKIRACESETAAQVVLEHLIAEHKAAERQVCWDEVNSAIKTGPLPGNGCDETAQRNGLVMASNIIMARIERANN